MASSDAMMKSGPAGVCTDSNEDVVALISGKHAAAVGLLIQLKGLLYIALPSTHHEQAAICGGCRLELVGLHLLKDLHS